MVDEKRISKMLEQSAWVGFGVDVSRRRNLCNYRCSLLAMLATWYSLHELLAVLPAPRAPYCWCFLLAATGAFCLPTSGGAFYSLRAVLATGHSYYRCSQLAVLSYLQLSTLSS